MPTPIFICGAECGIAAVGTTHPGVEHWSSVTNTPTVVTSGPSSMRSTRAFRFNPSASTQVLQHTFAAAISSPATMVGRCYVYFTTLPDADVYLVADNDVGMGVKFQQSDSKIYAYSGSGNGATGVSVTTGQWYRIDWKFVRATTRTCDVQVDGSACGQATVASSNGTLTIVRFGFAPGNYSGDWYIDDICVSGTSGDYGIGAGTVVGLYPDGDLTNSAANPTDGNSGHFYSATTDFGKGSGGGTNLGAQNAESTSYQSLASPLSTSVGTNFLANKTGASTEHLVHTYADMPTDVSSVNGLACVSTHHAASATANTQRLLVRRGTTSDFYPIDNAGAFIDLSIDTIQVVYRCKATDSTAAAWTKTTVDTLQTVWDADDVNPDAYLDGVCFEVDYVQTTSTPITDSDSATLTDANSGIATASVQGDSATLSETSTISAAAQASDTVTLTEGVPQIGVGGSDTGTVSEGVPEIGPSSTDSATLSETGSASVTTADSDSGTLSEGVPQIGVSGSDSATLTDTGAVQEVLGVTASDSATLSEDAGLDLPGVDSGSLTDTAGVGAAVAHSDSITASEGVPEIGTFSSDAATFTDDGSVVETPVGGPTEVTGSDSATLDETASIAVTTVDSDDATLSDSGTVTDLSAPPVQPASETSGYVVGRPLRGRVIRTVNTFDFGARTFSHHRLRVRVVHRCGLVTIRSTHKQRVTRRHESRCVTRQRRQVGVGQRSVSVKRQTDASLAWIAEVNRREELEMLAFL